MKQVLDAVQMELRARNEAEAGVVRLKERAVEWTEKADKLRREAETIEERAVAAAKNGKSEAKLHGRLREIAHELTEAEAWAKRFTDHIGPAENARVAAQQALNVAVNLALTGAQRERAVELDRLYGVTLDFANSWEADMTALRSELRFSIAVPVRNLVPPCLTTQTAPVGAALMFQRMCQFQCMCQGREVRRAEPEPIETAAPAADMAPLLGGLVRAPETPAESA
jgi:hypothetical protein